MKGMQLKLYFKEKGLSVTEIAKRIGTTQANLSSALNSDDIRTGLLEQISVAVGKDVPFFYGFDTSSCGVVASGQGSTAVAGNRNNVNSEGFVQLLAKKDEQIDRLLNVIESLTKQIK